MGEEFFHWVLTVLWHASCRHRSVYNEKIRALLPSPRMLVIAAAWVRSFSFHITPSAGPPASAGRLARARPAQANGGRQRLTRPHSPHQARNVAYTSVRCGPGRTISARPTSYASRRSRSWRRYPGTAGHLGISVRGSRPGVVCGGAPIVLALMVPQPPGPTIRPGGPARDTAPRGTPVASAGTRHHRGHVQGRSC